jgi:hypothetical protein
LDFVCLGFQFQVQSGLIHNVFASLYQTLSLITKTLYSTYLDWYRSISEILAQLDIIYFRFQIRTCRKRVCFASNFEIRFLSLVFISCSISSTYPTYLGVVSSFLNISWVFSLIRISDRFACYSRDYHRSFVFACFLVFIASWVIYIWIALLSWI